MSNDQRLIDLIPSDWFKDRAKSSVWIRCYWARPIVAARFSDQLVVHLARALLVFFRGSVTFAYAERPDIEPTEDRDARFRTPKRYGQAATPPGTYAFTIAPHDVDGIEAREDVTEAQQDQLEGLLTSYGGRSSSLLRSLHSNARTFLPFPALLPDARFALASQRLSIIERGTDPATIRTETAPVSPGAAAAAGPGPPQPAARTPALTRWSITDLNFDLLYSPELHEQIGIAVASPR